MKPRFSLWERGFFVRRSLSSSISSPRFWIHTLFRDTAIRNAEPRDKTYTIGDGESMYFEVMPNGTRFWRMAYRQPNGKKNRLTFGKYPEVSLAEARDKRLAARKLMAQGIDPGMQCSGRHLTAHCYLHRNAANSPMQSPHRRRGDTCAIRLRGSDASFHAHFGGVHGSASGRRGG